MPDLSLVELAKTVVLSDTAMLQRNLLYTGVTGGIVGEEGKEGKVFTDIPGDGMISSDPQKSHTSLERPVMSAGQALRAARAAGIHLEVEGDDLLLEAPAPPPTAVLEALSQHKADVVRMLRLAKDVWSAEDWQLPMECDQCGKSTGTVQQAWICDPGGQPITARLHRECEAAFLQQLEPSWDFMAGPAAGSAQS